MRTINLNISLSKYVNYANATNKFQDTHERNCLHAAPSRTKKPQTRGVLRKNKQNDADDVCRRRFIGNSPPSLKHLMRL